ncbi:MAG: cytidylate kinase [Candidatus Aenigmatarchaeota archaeon]|nr:MAG: cytidylate kinase [Candidatus Aenigmarchaeota archaeon]
MVDVVVVTISGPTGSGKSTIAKLLAKKLGVDYYSIGDFFRQKAKEAGMDVKEFTEKAPKEFHLEADSHVDELSKKGNIVIEGRLVGYMASHADYRIYLTAPLEVRAKRIAGRNNISLQEARKRVVEREKEHKRIFKEVYGLDLERLDIYDLVLNTEFYDIGEVLMLVEKLVRVALKI